MMTDLVPAVAARWLGRIASALAFSLAALPAHAQQALAEFELFVDTVAAARGTFSQSSISPDGQATQAQTGEFVFARPGRFRWDILQPHEQQVVSDGKTLYQYDPDLQQLTVRELDQSIGSSPAAILFGQGQLQEAFEVSELPPSDGMLWLRAVARQPDAGLSQVDIGMREGRPHRLLLLDGFGQTTQVELLTLRAQPGFGAEVFTIDTPPGTDVVRMQ